MKKNLCTTLVALVVSVIMGLSCFAADSINKVVYDGTSLTYEGTNQMSGFSNMLPGKTYKGSIQLENKGTNAANFYMDTSVVQTLIGASNTKDTGYTVTLTCGNTVLYGYNPVTAKATGSLIGGDGSQGLEELNKQLEEYPLVATLNPGESTTVTLSVQPDATATGNSYMSADGSIEFRFQASDVPQVRTVVKTQTVQEKPNVVTQVRTVVQAAQTDDVNTIFVCAIVAAVALVLFLVLSSKKQENEQNENDEE